MYRAALTAAMILLAAPAAAGDLRLGIPLDCTLGESCFIQKFVDRDPGPGVRDWQCGSLTTDGHKGIDFTVPTLADMARGVSVLAAAPGVVIRTRTGVTDQMYSESDAEKIEGRDCGNGVMIQHEDGWKTQYCHLGKGSIRVRKGDTVDQGDTLGFVGLSGKTQFPHVHLTVYHDDIVVDPFSVAENPDCENTAEGMWLDRFDYVPGALVFAGFSPAAPVFEAVEAGVAVQSEISNSAPALILFGFAFGALKGDIIHFDISGPQGWAWSRDTVVDKDRLRLMQYGGKRPPPTGWPRGTYVGTVIMTRDNIELGRKMTRTEIR